jgi:hypothetical protein
VKPETVRKKLRQPSFAAGVHEARQLVAGEQGALERGVAGNPGVVGVRQHRLDHDLRPALRAQDRRAVLGVLVERRVDLVVEVVEQGRAAPQLLVLAALPGVPAHRGLHGQRVAEQALAGRVPGERLPGPCARHLHDPGP